MEVFSAQGRDPVAKWRLNGSASAKSKVYDKDVKSFVYILEGETTTTKITLPKDEKQSLWLLQRFLVLQLYVPLGHSFSVEFGITDSGNNKRRILLSSNHREVTITHFHARFPLNILRLGVWLNLCMDLQSLISETFKGQSFKALENLTISASCRLRKIFTMKLQPYDTTDDDEIYSCGNTNSGEMDHIPKALQLSTSPDIQFYTQVINMAKLWHTEIKSREKAGLPPPSTPVFSDSELSSRQEEEPTHIAFGSKVVIPKHARKSSREGSSSSAGSRSSSGLNRSGSIPQLRTVSPAVEPESARESSRQTQRLPCQRSLSDATNSVSSEQSVVQLEIEASQSTMQPRPPRTGSGGTSRRRPFRVKHPGSGNVKGSNTDVMKDVTNSIKTDTNGAESKNGFYEKDMDFNLESMSRSHSESSLKMSGSENSLSESLHKLQMKIPSKEQNGHNNNYYGDHDGNSKESIPVSADEEKESPPVFTFSSKPRSAPRSPRNRQRKHQDNSVTSAQEDKPVIQSLHTLNVTETKKQGRRRKDSNRSDYDSDFHRASGESSAEEDDLQNFLKTSGNSRCSSKGSKLSPLTPSPEPDPLSNSQILRMSIKSSLLKEIPSPRKNNTKSYDAKNYQSDTSSWRNFQSDASSWRFDTSDMSDSMLENSLNQSFNSPFGKNHSVIAGIPEESEEIIAQNDGGDSLSDDSDDTSYSTWKRPPPPDKRIHRYLDEMRHPGPEPDLTVTLPLNPREYTDVFSPPIVLPSERLRLSSASQNDALSAALSPPRSRNPSSSVDNNPGKEEELDLLYDPCLNCYFDPRTHKYYELA